MNLLFTQADYMRTNKALESGRALVKRKVENCVFLLSRYERSVRRTDKEKASILAEKKYAARATLQKVTTTKNTQELLLAEARAAEVYYQGIAIVIGNRSWRRKRHGNIDVLNLVLNIGYHLLTQECEKVLHEAGLYLEVGFVHGATSGKPLLYDFVEMFRQPCVDRIALPLFSRKKVTESGEKEKARFLKRFQHGLDSYFWYKNRCEKMRRIFLLETYSLKEAMMQDKIFLPYRHRWGNSSPCNKKAPSPEDA